jgi:hypothetical protein
MSNGVLLAAAEKAGFDVLVTADRGLNFQQNLEGFKLALVVLSSNRQSLVIEGAPRISTAIEEAKAGNFTFVDIGA